MLKKIIKNMDEVFLNKAIKKNFIKNSNEYTDKKLTKLDEDSNFKMVIRYKKNNKSLFSQLCDLYGSDKGEIKEENHPYPWPSHTYADFYSLLFSHCRMNVERVFECGIGTNNPSLVSSMGSLGKPGASLRVWRDYFPNAMIYGADIDKEILFHDDRIETYFIDQTNPEIISSYWSRMGDQKFDLMIDDGLHTYEAGICLFENSIKNLSEEGVYIIEDVEVSDLLMFQKYFEKTSYTVNYINLYRPFSKLGDNNLVVIRHS